MSGPAGEPVAAGALPGDEFIPAAPLSWDREARFAAPPAEVWPWLVQLGKGRAGWYVPTWADRLIPGSRRSLRRIDESFQSVAVGDRVPDYGPDGWFQAKIVDAPHALVWWTERGRGLQFSWALVLEPDGAGSRLRIRIRTNRRVGNRLRPVLEPLAELADRVFIALMTAGLRERVG